MIQSVAIRCDCNTEQVYEAPIELSVRKFGLICGQMFPHWCCISKGGVTGCEAFAITEDNKKTLCLEGWSACCGTEKKWDALYVDALHMQAIFGQLGEYLQSTSGEAVAKTA